MKEVKTTNGQVFQIDDEDFYEISKYVWSSEKSSEQTTFYVRRKTPMKYRKLGGRHNVLLHRLLLNPSDGLFVDHIDGNGLNNQKSNLRICTKEENSKNRKTNKNSISGFKGVGWHKGVNKWRARIRNDNKYHFLGFFASAVEAAKAYNEAAVKYHGEFARLNLIKENV